MESNYIKISEFITHHNVETSFIIELEEEGIISLQREENTIYIDEDLLPNLEMFSRWHYEMGINIAGIDALRHTVERIKQLQEELNQLKRQRFFDNSL